MDKAIKSNGSGSGKRPLQFVSENDINIETGSRKTNSKSERELLAMLKIKDAYISRLLTENAFLRIRISELDDVKQNDVQNGLSDITATPKKRKVMTSNGDSVSPHRMSYKTENISTPPHSIRISQKLYSPSPQKSTKKRHSTTIAELSTQKKEDKDSDHLSLSSLSDRLRNIEESIQKIGSSSKKEKSVSDSDTEVDQISQQIAQKKSESVRSLLKDWQRYDHNDLLSPVQTAVSSLATMNSLFGDSPVEKSTRLEKTSPSSVADLLDDRSSSSVSSEIKFHLSESPIVGIPGLSSKSSNVLISDLPIVRAKMNDWKSKYGRDNRNEES